MMTYVLLNSVFFAVLAVFVWVLRRDISRRSIMVGLAVVLALTAVFDPVMIAVDLVRYNPEKLLGAYWFGAPIEDFAYALVAVPLVAGLWQLFGDRHDK